jgi:hypothetical protein
MAKTKPKAARKPSEEVLGQTREELLRDLGLDQLTREACLRACVGCSAICLDERGPGGDGWTVIQVGPG